MFYNPIEDRVLSQDVLKAVASKYQNKIKSDYKYEELREILSKENSKKETTHLFIGSNKGGVGKSMSALQITWFLNARGYKVLLADLDAQANITCSLLDDDSKSEADFSFYDVLTGKASFDDIIFEVAPGFDLIGGNQNLSEVDHYLRKKEEHESEKYFDRDATQAPDTNEVYLQTYKMFKELGRDYDFVIYDTNPETNKFNRISMQMSDIALIPMQAKESSAKAYMVTLNEINDSFLTIGRDTALIRDRVKLLFNNNNYIPEHKKDGIINKIYSHFNGNILPAYVDYSYELGEASDVGWPAFAHNEISIETIENIAAVVDEVVLMANQLEEWQVSSSRKRRHMFLSEGA